MDVPIVPPKELQEEKSKPIIKTEKHKNNVIQFPIKSVVPPQFRTEQTKNYVEYASKELRSNITNALLALGFKIDTELSYQDLTAISILIRAALYRSEHLENEDIQVLDWLNNEIFLLDDDGEEAEEKVEE